MMAQNIEDMLEVLEAQAAEPRPVVHVYAGTCVGGPLHDEEVTAVTGKIVVPYDAVCSAKGFYRFHPKYRTWVWLGWG